MSDNCTVIDWQNWTAWAHRHACNALAAGDIDDAIWWQQCAADDYTRMWELLSAAIENPSN